MSSHSSVTAHSHPDPHPADLVEVDAWWASGARQAIETLAAVGLPFTADALREDPFNLPDPHHPSQIGAAFRAASQAGLIRPVGYATSLVPSRHGGVVRLWRGNRTAPTAGDRS